jgi:uncharacterized membrane protein YqjE
MADIAVNPDQRSPRPHDRATEPLLPERSLGELFSDLSTEFGDLFRKEVALAKTEATSELKQAGASVGMFAGAAVSALLALGMLSLALAWLLDKSLDLALSFALVGLLWVVIGGVLAMLAKNKAAEVEPLPETVQSLKEDAQWIKAQRS